MASRKERRMTGIQWTDETWNPTTGCDRVSPGCDNCYALTMAGRLKGMGQAKYQRDGDPKTSGPGFGLTTHLDALDLPFRWRKPRRVFVNSMSDLFHDEVPVTFIAAVFDVMRQTPQHTYQILTKRHARMRSLSKTAAFGEGWPLPNVWLGVSAEDQHWADIRIPALIETRAAVRFVSAEPLLGPISLDRYLWLNGPSTAGPFYDYAGRRRFGGGVGGQAITNIPARDLHWVIVGGESGPGARPMDSGWADRLVWECREAEVAVFVKQLGSILGRELGAGPKGGDFDAWPEDLRVREFPVMRSAA
jgi:protein gp37